jgi:hypothetical protein
MAATSFQKLSVDHVGVPANMGGTDPDYPSLARGGFEAVYFRPESGVNKVAGWIKRARTMKTWRGTPFDGNVWFADPRSEDSQQAGIPTDAVGWANYVVDFVRKLAAAGAAPTVLKLNTEFSFKGFPPWKANTDVAKWAHCYAETPGARRLFTCLQAGKTAATPPKWPEPNTAPVMDGTVQWGLQDANYGFDGWTFCETVARVVRAGLPNQAVITQPMSSQSDFNRGAFFSRWFRESPQCYGDQPYNQVHSPSSEIYVSSHDVYSMAYYGVLMDHRFVHPTIGAYGQGVFYVPRLLDARKGGIFGFGLYRSDNLADSDYNDYRQFVIV